MTEKTQNKWEAIAEKDLDEEALNANDKKKEIPVEDEAENTPPQGLDHPDYHALQDKLTETEQKVHEYWEARTRAIAELDNVRKRSERDVENAHKFAIERIINDLLAVIDSLEQALATTETEDEEGSPTQEGIKLTVQLFLSTLEKHHVKQISPEGELFDPNQHEAMSMQPSDEVAPGTVLQVFQKGYLLHDRVIRPARVIVSKENS